MMKTEMSKPINSKLKKQMTREAEDRTLAGADIILSTMSSSVVREMDRFFIQGNYQCINLLARAILST